jgi:hypothetical protein
MKKTLWLLIFLLMSTACAPWTRIGGLYESPVNGYSVNIPPGWMKLNVDEHLLITKDGPFLQYVLVQSFPIGRPFKHTKKKFNPTMLPEEAAEVILDDIISDRSVLNLAILENTPATIDRQDAFRIVFTYHTKDSAKLKTIYYGLMHGDRFYSIRYNAAARYYFDKDVAAFEKILNGFKLL